jgi:hypothetical protein
MNAMNVSLMSLGRQAVVSSVSASTRKVQAMKGES